MTTVLSKIKVTLAAIALLCIFSSPVFPLAAAPPAGNSVPALLLEGTLEDTPQTITLCAPLNIRFSVRNTGTVPVSTGTLTVDVKSANTGESVFTRRLRFTTDTSSIMIEKEPFSQGEYTITLKASAVNLENQIAREFTLAEQTLTVSAPVLVNKMNAATPRVLLWLSRTGTAVQQAFAEKIVKQALEDEGIYYLIVDTAEDFTNRASTGEFNTAVLFETEELLESSDWLTDRIAGGQGLVIVGSGNRSRMTAETFGFKFSENLTTAGTMITLTEETGMGLCGTIPVSGKLLIPQKEGAMPAALLAKNKKPAMLIDKRGNGRVIVMPFSLTRSAFEAGTTSLYSLLLNAAVRNAAPENDKQSGVSSIELLVSAPSGPVNARIVETLPQGTRVIWTNAKGTVKDNTIIFDLVADKEPRKLLYVCQPPAGNKGPASTEVFYECNESLVSQGTIE